MLEINRETKSRPSKKYASKKIYAFKMIFSHRKAYSVHRHRWSHILTREALYE